MLLYNSIGPNPRVVRMFAAEKGLDLPKQEVDLRGGENRREAYVSTVNPWGTLPALRLDNGTVLSEITAICEYLEELKPSPPLIGTTPEQRAETRMWVRRIDLNYVENVVAGFRYAEGEKLFTGRMRLIPHAAGDFKLKAADTLAWLEKQVAGRTYVCGDRMTLADIMLFAFVDFAGQVKQPFDPGLRTIAAMYERMKARASAAA
jgi:glutathione S-transferase